MNKSKSILVILFSVFLFSKCERNKKLSNPSSFKEIVQLYTSNNQSVASPVIIQFIEDAVTEEGKSVNDKVFEISPQIEGELIWKRKNRLEFTPKGTLESRQNYTVTVNLDEIFANVPDSLGAFTFDFTTIKQNFQFGGSYLTPINDSLFKVSCSIITADVIDPDEIVSMVNIEGSCKEQPIKWKNNISGRSKREHYFYVDSVKREKEAHDLIMMINSYGIKKNKKIRVPAIGDFKLIDTRVNQEHAQQIVLTFSDFIDPNQSLEGIIYPNKGDYEIMVNDNFVTINFKEYITDDIKITIENGLTSIKQFNLQEKYVKSVSFDEIPPGIRLTDKNTILPYGNIMPFSFETVNIKSVDIRITKIYQKNILQFLQQNELNESYNIQYVGEPILVKKIDLGANQNQHFWNKQVINLRPFIQKDPGALYRIEVGFRRSYMLCDCDVLENKHFDPSTINVQEEKKITPQNFWVNHDMTDSYNWEERENPCHPMFYTESYNSENKHIKTNILGSNLGVIAKQEKKGGLLVTATSIKTASPIFGAKVEVFNIQNKKIGIGYTNEQGIVKLNKMEDPFLVKVSAWNQKGYLKLGYYEELNLSQFNVGGSSNKQDVEGFLYAERGVWRPGDSIFINLIVEDKFKTLPANYPIGFEFINPNYQRVERRVVTKSLNGHYKFWTKTALNDITGDYEVRAFVGNNTYSKTIKVETIRPNRLKMNIAIGEGKELYSDSNILTEINTKWLHGAPGKNLEHKVNVVLTHLSPSFKGYNGYSFVAPYRSFDASEFLFLDEETDEKGQISVRGKMEDCKSAPGFLKANFKIKAFEKGGRFSIDEVTKTLYPYHSYVGLKSLNNKYYYGYNQPVKRSFVNLNANGEKTKSKLFVKLYQLEYDWWYDINENSTYVYKGQMNKKAIRKDTIIATTGMAEYKFILGDKYREGRYLLMVENEEGHKTGEVIYFSNSVGYETTPIETKGTKKLTLKLNKSAYKLGEWVELSIPTAKAGKILVSIEDGQQILETKWVNVSSKGNTTVYRFKAKHKMSPYVYANVVYVQPHEYKENDLPLRMYGVIPVKVDSKNSYLNPVIMMKDELKPKKPYQIRVKESKGLPMTYTLAVVDEGLLNITQYKAPNIWSEFNQKPALEVKTWDVFDRVIKAEKFNIKNLLSIGGDGYDEAPEGVKLNRFKPVVKFIGPFYCAPGQTKTHNLNMPNYVGAMRVMVVAGHNKAYGKASKTVPVKNALMVLGTMPRVLGPNEQLQLPVDVFAMKKHIKNVQVSVKGNDLVEFTGDTKQQLKFSKLEDKQVYFKLKTKEKFGVAKLRVEAISGNEKAVYDVELEVRPSNTNKILSTSQVLAPGMKFDQLFSSYGYKGTNNITIEVSSIPSINLEKRLNYLIKYPYGCAEQTTSSVFPQLYLNDLMDLSNQRKRKIESNINAGIQRLKRFQTSDGGFAYWPGGNESHEWATNYVGHFLLEAKAKGYKVDESRLDKWIASQDEAATQWVNNKYSDKLPQAYRLYLLAKAGKANVGAMNRLKMSISDMDLALWYLASAYHMVGQISVSNELLKQAPKVISNNTSQIESFGSRNRDNAIILLMLSELDKKKEAFKMAKSLAEELNRNQYMSTQTTAYCLLAISHFISSKGDSKGMKFMVHSDRKEQVNSTKTVWGKSLKYDGKQPISVENNSKHPLYLTITQNGIPKASKDTLNESYGLKMYVQYTDISGRIIDYKKLKQGEDFIAEVRVVNTSDKYQKHVSLSQVFPSGWEIQNTRLNETTVWHNKVNYEDIRDDRVNLFYNIGKNQQKKFKVFLNASYKGRYYLPAIQTEAMYDHDIRARKTGQWIEVVE